MSLTYTETLITVHCWCGIPFAIPENRFDWMKGKSDRNCYCPNGHTLVFRDSFEQRLERERREHQATRDLLKAEERSHSATRGQLTKAKKQVHRAERGTCPHCKRHFANVQRHVQTKHPECLA